MNNRDILLERMIRIGHKSGGVSVAHFIDSTEKATLAESANISMSIGHCCRSRAH